MANRTAVITPDCVDYGNTAEYFVNGIAKITRVGNGVVRVTFSSEETEGSKHVALHVLWDAETYFAFMAMAYGAAEALAAGGPSAAPASAIMH